jgi:glucosamine-6-phosphate deaminase
MVMVSSLVRSIDRGTVEHLPVLVFRDSSGANAQVAAEIAALIRARQKEKRRAVLGLATGSTPLGVYEELVRLHQKEGLSFANVVTFNLDEYWPMGPGDLQSYRRFMRENFFDRVDIDPANTNIPDGACPADSVAEHCAAYERAIDAAGGVDIQILGIGRTGHIGFNEPGSPRDSVTRLITLDRVTRADAASDFFGESNVPRRAITMGVGTILRARRMVLMAFGEHKAGIVRKTVEESVTSTIAASYLQEHPNTTVVLDAASAAELTRIKTPWRLERVEKWSDTLVRRAVIWLACHVDKPILKLTDEDYNEHHLQDLLTARGEDGGAYDINIQVFRSLQRTITGWPGGKPESEGGSKGTVFPKRVVVFSPHPDDDVISMGGTFIRLCEHGHDVHVAYQTSGNIAVWDESAIRHADFVREFAQVFPSLGREFAAKLEGAIEEFIAHKHPGEPDSPELQQIKGLIRRTEARAAARYSGVKPENIHFLDLPFYETGRVRKKPLGEEDVRITVDLLRRVRPHQVYAAGDLSDPHGTHRVCLAAITRALEVVKNDEWMKGCEVWLYRGAWQEWGADEIEMAVPLAPSEVRRKRTAIFKHESQKDSALFPGPSDAREFWQRAEERNRNTAKLFDKLGLAEYEAIEGFVRLATVV